MRPKLFNRPFIPDIASVFAEKLLDIIKQDFVPDRLSVFAVENRNRNTPETLTGNAPVVPVAQPILETCLAPDRKVFDFIGFFQKLCFNLVDGAEPLRGGTENSRLLRTPVMRIGMDDFFRGKKISVLFENL